MRIVEHVRRPHVVAKKHVIDHQPPPPNTLIPVKRNRRRETISGQRFFCLSPTFVDTAK